MRGDAVLGITVHILGSDLDLRALAIGADHRGMQGSIPVRFGVPEEVLEARGHGPPGGVDQAQGCVAVLGRPIDHHPKREHVVDLVHVNILRLHLPVNRSKLLEPPLHLGLDPTRFQRGGDQPDHFLDITLTLISTSRQLTRNLFDRLGVKRPKTILFEFLHHPANTQSMRERNVDFHRLLSDALSGFILEMLEGAHIVETVGKLDQQDSNIRRHGDQHLAEIFSLSFPNRSKFDLRDLREAFDDKSDLLAENSLDLLAGGQGVLEGVVEQRRRDGHVVHSQITEDARHLQGMNEIGLSGQPLLPLVHLRREDIGLLHQFEVSVGAVVEDAVRYIVESQQGE